MWELEAVADDYERRADTMLQHQRFCRVLLREMRQRGFAETDTVGKLYAGT